MHIYRLSNELELISFIVLKIRKVFVSPNTTFLEDTYSKETKSNEKALLEKMNESVPSSATSKICIEPLINGSVQPKNFMGVDFNGNNTQATPQLVISIDETGITIVGKMNLIIIHSRATEGTVTEIIDQGNYDIMGESFETIIIEQRKLPYPSRNSWRTKTQNPGNMLRYEKWKPYILAKSGIF